MIYTNYLYKELKKLEVPNILLAIILIFAPPIGLYFLFKKANMTLINKLLTGVVLCLLSLMLYLYLYQSSITANSIFFF